jgi:hypothetical protein
MNADTATSTALTADGGSNRRWTPMDADDTTSKAGCRRIGVYRRSSAVDAVPLFALAACSALQASAEEAGAPPSRPGRVRGRIILERACVVAGKPGHGAEGPAGDKADGGERPGDEPSPDAPAPPPAGYVLKVSAIDRNVRTPPTAREVAVREFEGRLIEGGSRYEIELPAGTYDVHVELEDGRVIEGADMRVEAGPGAPPLKERDREAIAERVLKMRTFANEKEVLAVAGAGDQAKALVKLVRTKPTSYGREFGGPVGIVRWEVSRFRKHTGSWVRERKAKVLRRFIMPRRRLAEVNWVFSPDLGGVRVEAGAAVEREVALDAPPASRQEEGRPTRPASR